MESVLPVAGVDGCRKGWVVVFNGNAFVCESFAAVLAGLPDDAIVAVDIPIGLEEQYTFGGRECDRLARAQLGRLRGTSVFPAPPRPALPARSLSAARSLGWPATLQALNISEKVEQVDHAMTPALQDRVFEVHPELSFSELNGGHPVVSKKRIRAGRDERWALLECARQTKPERPHAGEAEDDLLDACAAAWSARRIARDGGGCLPEDPPHDARGLRMEIRW
jgi:predicted RNase H-like nuclease